MCVCVSKYLLERKRMFTLLRDISIAIQSSLSFIEDRRIKVEVVASTKIGRKIRSALTAKKGVINIAEKKKYFSVEKCSSLSSLFLCVWELETCANIYITLFDFLFNDPNYN